MMAQVPDAARCTVHAARCVECRKVGGINACCVLHNVRAASFRAVRCDTRYTLRGMRHVLC